MAPDGEPWCERCNNLRWLFREGTDGPPGSGALVPCPDCGVTARRRIARFARYSSLRGHALAQRFEGFSHEGEAQAATEAFNAALRFAADPKGWLVLHGENGNGKSHLAAAIANHLVERGRVPVLFITVPDFLHSLREALRGNGQEGDEYSARLNAAREVDVLILDDLGAERLSEWAEEVLFVILDHRYRGERPTVVITNLALEALPLRLGSRLADRRLCQVVYNPAPDYRRSEEHARHSIHDR
jgi:DNA replication protein DnaC